MLSKSTRKGLNTGASLVELLVGLVVGLAVLAGAGSFLLINNRAALDTTRTVRLNQELNRYLDLMSGEIRRAGFLSVTPSANPVTNPYANVNIYENGRCIIYGYDMDANGTDNPPEWSGFRINNGILQMLETGAAVTSCADNARWQTVSDNQLLTITTPTPFALRNLCPRNPTNPTVDVTSTTCVCTNVTPNVPAVRFVDITLQAQLVQDAAIRQIQTTGVRIRNECTL